MITVGDYGLFLYKPLFQFTNNLSLWNSYWGTGFFNYNVADAALPVLAFESFFKIIGFPYWAIQATIYSVALLVTSLSFFFLIQYLGKHYAFERPKLSAFLGALFLIFNPYTIFLFRQYFQVYFRFAVILLALLFYTRGIISKKYLSNSVFLSVSVALFSVNFVGPAYVVALVLVLFVFLVFYLAVERFRKRALIEILKFNSILMGVFILINLWWILSLVLHLGYFESYGYSNIILSNLEVLKSFSPSLFQTFIIRGEPFVYGNVTLFYSYIALLIPICAIFSLILYRKHWFIWYLFSILAIGIFLSKGVSAPFGNIYLFLFNNIPGFQAFRSPYDKFGALIVFSYSALIGLFFGKIYRFFEVKKLLSVFLAVVIICFGIFLFNANPMLTGEVLYYPSNEGFFYVEVPSEYKNVAAYFKDNENYRVLQIPLVQLLYAMYDWAYGYSGADPSFLLYEKPTIFSSGWWDQNNKISNVMHQLITHRDPDFTKLLNWLNIKYILVDLSKVDYVTDKTISAKQLLELDSLFKESGKIREVNKFGLLLIYENTSFRPEFEVVVPKTLAYVYGHYESLKNILKIKENVDDIAFVFSESPQLNDDSRSAVIDSSDDIYISYYCFADVDSDQRIKMDSGFYVPKDGEYDIFLCLDEQNENVLNSSSDARFLIRGKEKTYENRLLDRTSNYLYFGDRKLKEGIQDLELKIGDVTYADINILKNIVLISKQTTDNTIPEISYAKKSPTHYRITGARDADVLMLNQTYHRYWRITNNSNYHHISANGYANLWIKKDNAGPTPDNIKISFYVQNYFTIALIISLISIIASIVVVLVRKYRR